MGIGDHRAGSGDRDQPGVRDDLAASGFDVDPGPAGAHRSGGSRAAHPRRLWVLAVVAVLLVVALVVWLVSRGDDNDGARGAGPGPTTGDSITSATRAPATSSAPTRRASPTTAPKPDAAKALAAIRKVVADAPEGAAGVSATDLTTGRSVTAGSRTPMWTASMYKLLVLETLLRQNGPLGGSQLDTATRMIEQSDNVAGYALYQAGGGNPGLQTTLDRLGITDAHLNDGDPTFTRLAPADAVKMARALVKPGMLSASARAQALGLMRNVASDQRWGAGAVADKGTDFANKNGWLAVDNGNGNGNNDDGRWVVSTVGVVQVAGHTVLIGAMTEHRSDMPEGIVAVEAMSKAAVAVLGLTPRA